MTSAIGPAGSALVAVGTVLGFVVVGCHLEHVVTLDADAVNFWLVARDLLRLVFRFCSFIHGWILARSGSGRSAAKPDGLEGPEGRGRPHRRRGRGGEALRPPIPMAPAPIGKPRRLPARAAPVVRAPGDLPCLLPLPERLRKAFAPPRWPSSRRPATPFPELRFPFRATQPGRLFAASNLER